MLSLNTSTPRHAGGMGAKHGEVAKNNHHLPMTQTTLMPSTPRSTSSSAHWHPHQPSALVTPRPTPSKESIQSTLDNEDALTTMERTPTDLDAAHLLASIASQEHLIMTAEEETAVGTFGLIKNSSSPGLCINGHNDKTIEEEEEEAPPSPRLTYLCNVVDREEDCNRGTTRSALQDHRGLHVPKFASLQRGMPMMPPPAFAAPPPPPPPMMMTMGSSSPSEQDMAFRTRTISVDTADSYLAPDLAYLRNGYESGRLSGVPSTFVSVPTIISPPSSPSSGPRAVDSPTGTAISSTKRKNEHRDSPKGALVDAFLEDEEDEDNYVDAGADANDDDDEEYLPAAKRRSRKKHKSPRSTSNKASSAVVPSGSSSSRTKSARAARKGVYVSASTLLKNHKGAIQPAKSLKPRCSKGESNPKFRIVLREKFSWKLYPELEAFLIANRDEYLRYSALNYTVEQKTYNNELTQRLIDLASANGYVFDEQTFSFVCVRDRIRCYFKSYVQSRKKQGIVIGFAAKRAGLIKTNDLKKIASSKTKIIAPPLSPKASSLRQKTKK